MYQVMQLCFCYETGLMLDFCCRFLNVVGNGILNLHGFVNDKSLCKLGSLTFGVF